MNQGTLRIMWAEGRFTGNGLRFFHGPIQDIGRSEGRRKPGIPIRIGPARAVAGGAVAIQP